MNKQRKTARKPHKRSLTVTVDGEWYRNLERVARAMNTVAWCGKDNTAETVFDSFLWPLLETYLESPDEFGGLILSGIATGDNGFDAPEPTHSARKEELRTAFDGLKLPHQHRKTRTA